MGFFLKCGGGNSGEALIEAETHQELKAIGH